MSLFGTNGHAPDSGDQVRQAAYEALQTQAEAIELVESLFHRQIQRAADENATPNSKIQGDAEAKQAFFLLLSPEVQRGVLLGMIRNRRFWPRVRALVGSPPFAFLRPNDNSVLNAAGIARGRVNMTTENTIKPSSQIGDGQLFDSANRRFSIVSDDNKNSTATPTLRLRTASRAVLDCRLPKKKTTTKIKIVKSQEQAQIETLLFPRPGQSLRLQPHPALGGDSLVVTVQSVELRGMRASTARLFVSRSG